MHVATTSFNDVSNISSAMMGTFGFSDGSSLIVPALQSIEIRKDEPLKDLSKFSPKLRVLKVGDLSLLVEISLQIEGGYVARSSTLEFDAVGQGETEEEATEDIRHAIELLKEATVINTSE